MFKVQKYKCLMCGGDSEEKKLVMFYNKYEKDTPIICKKCEEIISDEKDIMKEGFLYEIDCRNLYEEHGKKPPSIKTLSVGYVTIDNGIKYLVYIKPLYLNEEMLEIISDIRKGNTKYENLKEHDDIFDERIYMDLESIELTEDKKPTDFVLNICPTASVFDYNTMSFLCMFSYMRLVLSNYDMPRSSVLSQKAESMYGKGMGHSPKKKNKFSVLKTGTKDISNAFLNNVLENTENVKELRNHDIEISNGRFMIKRRDNDNVHSNIQEVKIRWKEAKSLKENKNPCAEVELNAVNKNPCQEEEHSVLEVLETDLIGAENTEHTDLHNTREGLGQVILKGRSAGEVSSELGIWSIQMGELEEQDTIKNPSLYTYGSGGSSMGFDIGKGGDGSTWSSGKGGDTGTTWDSCSSFSASSTINPIRT